jgi:hypothetical protein
MKTALIAAALATGVMLGASAPVFAQYSFGAPTGAASQDGSTTVAPNHPSRGR